MHFGRTGSIPLTRLQLPAHLSLSEAFLGAKLSRHRSDPPEPQRSGSLIHPDYHDTPPVRHFLHLRLQISFPAMAPPSPPLLRSPLMHVHNRQSPLYTPYFLSLPPPSRYDSSADQSKIPKSTGKPTWPKSRNTIPESATMQ